MNRPKVLVVDDDEELRALLTRQLAGAGYEVTVAADAIGAVSTALRERPDLVVLDLGLPGGNGRTVLERLRSLPATASMAAVVITGNLVDVSTGDMLQHLGCSALLTKPVASAELLAAVDTVLRGAGVVETNEDARPAKRAAPDPWMDAPDRLREITHDANNALGVVVGLAELLAEGLLELQRDYPDPRWDRLVSYAERILSSAGRVGDFHGELYAAAREDSVVLSGSSRTATFGSRYL